MKRAILLLLVVACVGLFGQNEPMPFSFSQSEMEFPSRFQFGFRLEGNVSYSLGGGFGLFSDPWMGGEVGMPVYFRGKRDPRWALESGAYLNLFNMRSADEPIIFVDPQGNLQSSDFRPKVRQFRALVPVMVNYRSPAGKWNLEFSLGADAGVFLSTWIRWPEGDLAAAIPGPGTSFDSRLQIYTPALGVRGGIGMSRPINTVWEIRFSANFRNQVFGQWRELPDRERWTLPWYPASGGFAVELRR